MTDSLDSIPLDSVTGTPIEYRDKLRKFAAESAGGHLSNANDVEAGLFIVLVSAIKDYAAHIDRNRATQSTWTELAGDIAEQFDHDWINPTPEQLKYIKAEDVVRQFEYLHGKPRV